MFQASLQGEEGGRGWGRGAARRGGGCCPRSGASPGGGADARAARERAAGLLSPRVHAGAGRQLVVLRWVDRAAPRPGARGAVGRPGQLLQGQPGQVRSLTFRSGWRGRSASRSIPAVWRMRRGPGGAGSAATPGRRALGREGLHACWLARRSGPGTAGRPRQRTPAVGGSPPRGILVPGLPRRAPGCAAPCRGPLCAPYTVPQIPGTGTGHAAGVPTPSPAGWARHAAGSFPAGGTIKNRAAGAPAGTQRPRAPTAPARSTACAGAVTPDAGARWPWRPTLAEAVGRRGSPEEPPSRESHHTQGHELLI
jgi:hypothetical protein